MNICLIRCPSPFLIEDKAFPPLGLLSVGTVLKLAGHDVTIWDGDDIPLGFDAYGLGPTTPEYGYALHIKEMLRDVKIVIGGPYATIQPQQCLDDGFSCVVVGDGETVADRAFTTDYGIIEGEDRPLDEYPIPDRTLIDIKSYKNTLDGRLVTTIVTSKGCPYKCGFCCKNHCNVRLRSAEKVIEEVEYLYDLGYRALMYSEDIFIINRKRAEAVFNRMHELGIISRCLVRADVVTKYGSDFTDMMAANGCVEVGMGIESGSDTILKIANKGESVATIKKAIRMLKASGIRVKGFFIVGLPGESYETLNETKQFLDEMQLDDIDCKIFQPYLGSPIFDNREKYDIDWKEVPLKDQFYKGRPGEYAGTICTSALTTAQIVEQWVEMEAEYKCLN
jgi:anaerobic magnesium-protoporphyrin IX monomethyl ester cyclase